MTKDIRELLGVKKELDLLDKTIEDLKDISPDIKISILTDLMMANFFTDKENNKK